MTALWVNPSVLATYQGKPVAGNRGIYHMALPETACLSVNAVRISSKAVDALRLSFCLRCQAAFLKRKARRGG